jgi:putative tricarboxylic transport membrane protein
MIKTLNQRISLVLILISVIYLVLAYQLPAYPYTPVDSDVVPKGLGWLLIVLAVCLFFSKDSETAEQKARRDIPKKELVMVVAVFAFIFVYIMLLELIGFIAMTALFIFFCSWFLGYKKYIANLIVSILFPVFMYFVFTGFLKISLPKGILPF